MLLFEAEVLTRASLTSLSTTLCACWLNACVPHLRTTYLFYHASHRLSFIEREPHCLWHVVFRSLVIYSMIGSRSTFMQGIDSLSEDTPLCLLLWNYSEMQANWAPVQQDGRTTRGALGGGRALLACIHFLMMWTPFHLEWDLPDQPGSGWTVSGVKLASFGH